MGLHYNDLLDLISELSEIYDRQLVLDTIQDIAYELLINNEDLTLKKLKSNIKDRIRYFAYKERSYRELKFPLSVLE